MKIEKFYRKYANTPLDERFSILNLKELGMMTLSDVYKELQEIENKIRPDQIRISKLLDAVEWLWINKNL